MNHNVKTTKSRELPSNEKRISLTNHIDITIQQKQVLNVTYQLYNNT